MQLCFNGKVDDQVGGDYSLLVVGQRGLHVK